MQPSPPSVEPKENKNGYKGISGEGCEEQIREECRTSSSWPMTVDKPVENCRVNRFRKSAYASVQFNLGESPNTMTPKGAESSLVLTGITLFGDSICVSNQVELIYTEY
jgi:hypothetical protein